LECNLLIIGTYSRHSDTSQIFFASSAVVIDSYWNDIKVLENL
jgi:hypothetical protein